MKIDVTQIITDISGKPVEDGSLRKICTEALLNPLRGDENMNGADKATLFNLAVRITSEDEPDLSIEDWSKIKDRIGRAYAPLVVGRAYAMIDPTPLRAVESA